MICTYKELKEKYNRHEIGKKFDRELFKIERGYYSDNEHYNHLELLVKKYPNAIFTSDTVFFFFELTYYIPEKEYMANKSDAKPINESGVVQIYSVEEYFEVGRTATLYNGIVVNIYIYDKERMLIELVRNKNTISYDYYKEIIVSYRKIVDELDMTKLSNYLEIFKNKDGILNAIDREVF